ncbi:hypothetical protein CB0940_05764 [Cercospora beticola]|uniref:Gylcosyl hydrolase 115 C-terminal domain-containing protein n=1 Tax=Cercospora beticola TaxID=122368 RepID=A0A2G5HZG1_CERBT|nr:hypothetical protein CB0940_05764 [Cercospora beticola]PIA97916.1 hypothetical protein CB0940_05764 [Cercospora beticola]WPA98344.1 hypothetical protein RHO25_002956 [Cercospora beticola]
MMGRYRFLSLTAFLATSQAIWQEATINFEGHGLELAAPGSSPQIQCADNDSPGVLKACNDLAADFGRVTGSNGGLRLVAGDEAGRSNTSLILAVNNKTSFELESASATGATVIAGTIGHSHVIDDLVQRGVIDVSEIQDDWESYISVLVDNPIDDVAQALVIAGSDRRGTIFGIYSISEQIGVSPWHFWADAPGQKHDQIYASNVSVTQGPPSVKYRGIFINDEAPGLTGWIMDNFPPGEYGPGFNAEFYSTVFELLLRLRANYLWPAMWNSMFNVDDPRTQPLANDYGIVMGTSHTEPMTRATKEWTEFGEGEWFWGTNNASIYEFFVDGIERSQNYDNVVTVGMRGYHDTPISDDIQTELLEAVVAAQTEILERFHGDASTVPQLWCLYKEVQGYYEQGMQVPDYITLLWAEDNYGNIRRLPVGNETARSGGAGVYYHFDYVGDPRNYKWISTTKLTKTWEQMRLAYERQAREIWVVNVGDLKPVELPISHFLDMAYDISRFDKDSTPAYLQQWAAREFGQDVAAETAEVMYAYGKLSSRRKFELVDPSTYSILDYSEADRVLEEWRDAQRQAQAIYDSLSDDAKPAFFELVYHPVTAGANYHDIMISAALNNLYADQGRNSANDIADRVRELFTKDQQLTKQYHELLDGKWNHMMDQTHIGYSYWQQPMRQVLPPLRYVASMERSLVGDMKVAIQGSNASVPGDDRWHSLGSNALTMNPYNRYGQAQWIDIFQVGTLPFEWSISANATWLNFSQSSGSLAPEDPDVRVWVNVDWENVPDEVHHLVQVNISRSEDNSTQYLQQALYGAQFNMPQLWLNINNTRIPDDFTNGFVESDSVLSIQLEHWSEIVNSSDAVTYEVIPSLTKTGSGVTLSNVTANSQDVAAGPALRYNLYTFTEGINSTNITILTTPSLNTNPTRPLRYAVQLDDEEVQTVQPVVDQPNGQNPKGWLQAVADMAWKNTLTFAYSGPGEHTLTIWALEPALVLGSAWVDLGGLKPSYLGPPESFRVA